MDKETAKKELEQAMHDYAKAYNLTHEYNCLEGWEFTIMDGSNGDEHVFSSEY